MLPQTFETIQKNIVTIVEFWTAAVHLFPLSLKPFTVIFRKNFGLKNAWMDHKNTSQNCLPLSAANKMQMSLPNLCSFDAFRVLKNVLLKLPYSHNEDKFTLKNAHCFISIYHFPSENYNTSPNLQFFSNLSEICTPYVRLTYESILAIRFFLMIITFFSKEKHLFPTL